MAIINLIGHYLKEKGFNDTFAALEKEYGQPVNASRDNLPNQETLDEILNDRFNFNALDQELRNVEKDDRFKAWKTPYPTKAVAESALNEVIVSSDVIHHKQWVLISTAKQNLIILDFEGNIINTYSQIIGRVVIKSIASKDDDIFFGGMNGIVYHYKLEGEKLVKIGETQVHRRLIIDMKIEGLNLVTVGFDKLLKIVDLSTLEITDSFELLNVPVCFDTIATELGFLALIGYNESTILDLIGSNDKLERLYRISINDAEFYTAHFSPRKIQLTSISGDIYAAIGTSHEPYMRVIVVPISSFAATNDIKRNQILRNVLTMSPQDKFSTPNINWRVDGHGIWVLGDDGKLRGVNLSTEHIVELDCHESKVKHLLTFVTDGKESLITIGDDKLVKYWQ